jgi:hypothetical protein
MTTSMHRLQISLPKWQVQLLRERAREQGCSVAEVVRQMVQREAESRQTGASDDGLWAIAGIGEDPHPLIGGIPVSESPELYLTQAAPEEAEADQRGRPALKKAHASRPD